MAKVDTKSNLDTDASTQESIDAQEQHSPTTASSMAPSLEETEASISDPLQEIISKLNEELHKKNEAFLRAKAETENVRRRAIEERLKAQKFAIETLALDLLPIVDALSSALNNREANCDKVLEGIEMTQKLLMLALEKNAIKEILAEGEKFDPTQHQAVGTEICEAEPGRVIKVLQTGYCIHNRILRPTMVIVSKEKT